MDDHSNKKRTPPLATGIAIAAATLLTSGCHVMGLDKYNKADRYAVSCFGINSCHTQGNCATHLNGCRHQNSCAKKGLQQAPSREECERKGGVMYEP